MKAYNIIEKKRDGFELSQEEISWFLSSLLAGEVAEYQMSALLMAIYLKGMTPKETSYLTKVMLHSGKVLDFKEQHYIDKHSTGGVGDKTSFILAPIARACGVKVPMIAGRGLGHTGGTIDKIESVKGYKTNISLKKFESLVREQGVALMGQTKEIAPADRVLYSLRDVTATVASIPLITASIMSKKLAEGAKGIVMDIKTGQGAFMEKRSDAKALAKSLRATAHHFDKNMITIISDMNQPLGTHVGNSLEMIESVEILKGRGGKDLRELSLYLSGAMVHLAGKAKSIEAGIKLSKKVLDNGSALKEFKKMIKAQGGETAFINNYSKLPLTKTITQVKSQKSGYLKKINCLNFGHHCVSLGGGRRKASDKVDPAVGFVFHKKVSDRVKAGDVLLEIHHHKKQQNLVEKMVKEMIDSDLTISKSKVKKPELIKESHVSWSRS